MSGLRAAVLGAVLLAGAARMPASAAEPVTLTVASNAALFAPYFIASAKGYFQAEGLDVDIELVGGGVATPGLISGSVQYSAAAASAMSAIIKGAQLKVFLVSQDHPNYEIWSFDPAITTFKDRKDKPLAIVSRGGSDELAVRIYLKQNGFPPDFLAYIAMGEGPARLAAITSGAAGQRQGIILSTDVAEFARRGILDKGHRLADLLHDVVLVNGGLAATTKELTDHRDRAKGLLRAVRKGMLYMKAFKDGTADVLQKRVPSESRTAILDNIDEAVTYADFDGDVSMAKAREELAVRGELLNVPPDQIPPPERVYDFSLLHEVDQELKAAGWTPSP